MDKRPRERLSDLLTPSGRLPWKGLGNLLAGSKLSLGHVKETSGKAQ